MPIRNWVNWDQKGVDEDFWAFMGQAEENREQRERLRKINQSHVRQRKKARLRRVDQDLA